MSQAQSTGVCDKLALTLLISTAMTPPDPTLKGAKVMLFSAGVTPRKDLTTADLAECVFSGYAQSSAIVWNAPIKEEDGSYSVSSPSKQFIATSASPFVPDTVAGVAVIDAATPANLLYLAILDEPVTIDSADKGLDVIVTVNQGGLSVNTEVTSVS